MTNRQVRNRNDVTLWGWLESVWQGGSALCCGVGSQRPAGGGKSGRLQRGARAPRTCSPCAAAPAFDAAIVRNTPASPGVRLERKRADGGGGIAAGGGGGAAARRAGRSGGLLTALHFVVDVCAAGRPVPLQLLLAGFQCS